MRPRRLATHTPLPSTSSPPSHPQSLPPHSLSPTFPLVPKIKNVVQTHHTCFLHSSLSSGPPVIYEARPYTAAAMCVLGRTRNCSRDERATHQTCLAWRSLSSTCATVERSFFLWMGRGETDTRNGDDTSLHDEYFLLSVSVVDLPQLPAPRKEFMNNRQILVSPGFHPAHKTNDDFVLLNGGDYTVNSGICKTWVAKAQWTDSHSECEDVHAISVSRDGKCLLR